MWYCANLVHYGRARALLLFLCGFSLLLGMNGYALLRFMCGYALLMGMNGHALLRFICMCLCTAFIYLWLSAVFLSMGLITLP
jgi:hypothetical protein